MTSENIFPLAPTIQPLGEPKSVMDRLTALGVRAIQLSATQPGTRPRELNRSARRDLLATLRRRELILAGLDGWIPPAHFLDPEHADRAVASLCSMIELAADLGRCPVSVALPLPVIPAQAETRSPTTERENAGDDLIRTISHHAARHGVPIANYTLPLRGRTGERADSRNYAQYEGLGFGLDTAAALANHDDPVSLLHTPHLASIHLTDISITGLRGPIGDSSENQIDIPAFRATLAVVNFRRPVALDLRQWADPWSGIAPSLVAWASAAP